MQRQGFCRGIHLLLWHGFRKAVHTDDTVRNKGRTRFCLSRENPGTNKDHFRLKADFIPGTAGDLCRESCREHVAKIVANPL